MTNAKKYNLIYFFKAVILCNGMASLCSSAITYIYVNNQSDNVSSYFLGVIYLVMALIGAWLASVGIPQNKAVRWGAIVFPVSVTMLSWDICVLLSLGNLDSSVFNFYVITQATHSVILSLAQATGGGIYAFITPVIFNAVYIAAFAFFSHLPKNRIPFAVKKAEGEPDEEQGNLKGVIMGFCAIAVITFLCCLIIK